MNYLEHDGLFVGDLMDKRWRDDGKPRCIFCGDETGTAAKTIMLDHEDRISRRGRPYPVGGTCAARLERFLAAASSGRREKEGDQP